MMSTNPNRKVPSSLAKGRTSNTPRKKKKGRSTHSTSEGSQRHFTPSIDKQLLFQSMIKQFSEWPTWQKRLILCKFTDRSSSTLLSTLSTVLEPIFHRDFEIKSKNGFHSSLLETFISNSNTTSIPSTATHSVRTSLSSRRSSLNVQNPEILVGNCYSNNGSEKCASTIESGTLYTPTHHITPSNLKLSSLSHGKMAGKLWRDHKRRRSTLVSSIDHELAIASINRNIEKRGILHTHMSRNSGSLTTGEFLPQVKKNNKQRLGSLVKLSNGKELTSIEQYKHEKWWLPAASKDHELQRASRTTLLKSFKKNADEFTHKYTLWSNAEKGDFMLRIVDNCSPDEIKFFANCIYQRLEKINDINNLNDKILLHTFSFLDCDDLENAAQVCQRWKYLTTENSLWEQKCYNLAHSHGQKEVVENLELSSAELNWKQLFYELKNSISVLESAEEKLSLQLENSDNNQPDLNLLDDALSLSSEDVVAGDNEKTSPKRISNSDEVECEDCKLDVIHSHVSFTEVHQIEAVEHIGFKDDMKDVYRTESEVNADPGLQTSEETKSDEDEKDLALDVRVRLVQAQNQMHKRTVKSSMEMAHYENDEPDYQLIEVSNIKTISRVRKLEGHGDAVLSLQFDSKRVMTGSADRTVRLWDIRTGRFFHQLVGHQGGVRCLKFDDKYIITGSWDTTIMVWDVVNFNLITTLAEHNDCVSGIEFTQHYVISSSYDSTICIFRKHTWELVTRLEQHEGPVSCMALLSEDKLLTGSYDKTLLLWDLDSFDVVQKFEGLSGFFLCVKVCGSLVVAGASDGTITFWNLLTSQMEGCITAHEGPVNAICFVTTRFFSAGGDGVVKEWDLSTCTCLRSLRGHTGAVLSLRASAKRVVSGSVDGTCRIWDMTYKLQQVGGKFDELNANIIQTQVLNEQQFKQMKLSAK